MGEIAGTAPRAMAFDVGDKRIGVAVTDGLGIGAQPLLTIYRKTLHLDLKSIGRLLRKHAVTELVVGNPLNMSGEAGPGAKKAEEFAAALRAEFGLPVHMVDERLTTWEAHRILDDLAASRPRKARTDGAPATGGRRGAADRKARRRVVDQVAAALILEAFLGREPKGRD